MHVAPTLCCHIGYGWCVELSGYRYPGARRYAVLVWVAGERGSIGRVQLQLLNHARGEPF